jgi:hypothetical protein
MRKGEFNVTVARTCMRSVRVFVWKELIEREWVF